MPNTTLSWQPLKSAAQHSNQWEVCGATAPGCASCRPADSDLRCSVLGDLGLSEHRDTRPVPCACPAAQENPAAATRPLSPAAAASAGSWQQDRQGAGSVRGFLWLLLLSWPGLTAPLSVHPPTCRTCWGCGHTHVCQSEELSAARDGGSRGIHGSVHTCACTHVYMHIHVCNCTQTHIHAHTCVDACAYPRVQM